MARPEGPKSKARMAESRGVLREGMFPSLPAREYGERCKLVWGKAPAIWQFRTFCRLSKRFLLSVLLILHLFQ